MNGTRIVKYIATVLAGISGFMATTVTPAWWIAAAVAVIVAGVAAHRGKTTGPWLLFTKYSTDGRDTRNYHHHSRYENSRGGHATYGYSRNGHHGPNRW